MSHTHPSGAKNKQLNGNNFVSKMMKNIDQINDFIPFVSVYMMYVVWLLGKIKLQIIMNEMKQMITKSNQRE